MSGAGKGFAYSFTALCLLGLVLAAALEATRPLCGGRRASIASNDRSIHGTRGPDVITGGRGPNVIHGGGGNDVICGGFGRDRIYGGRGKDTIDGKKDADLVHGGRGSDEVDGGAARDRVFGDSGNDTVRGGPGDRDLDTLYGGDDAEPDRLEGGGGDDALFGVNVLHPQHPSGAATMVGGGGNDLMIGGQPCDGDFFDGGPGENDSASFSRVRNAGTVVAAAIGGPVTDPDEPECAPGRISRSTEKIEGSTGPDVLTGSARDDTLLGRGGADVLDGRGGRDRCIGGNGEDRSSRCEYLR